MFQKRVEEPPIPPAVRRMIERWSPHEILHRGGRVTPDLERGYRDLQAARDHSEW